MLPLAALLLRCQRPRYGRLQLAGRRPQKYVLAGEHMPRGSCRQGLLHLQGCGSISSAMKQRAWPCRAKVSPLSLNIICFCGLTSARTCQICLQIFLSQTCTGHFQSARTWIRDQRFSLSKKSAACTAPVPGVPTLCVHRGSYDANRLSSCPCNRLPPNCFLVPTRRRTR